MERLLPFLIAGAFIVIAYALLDDLEDPVQAINQTIEDATKEYAQVKAAAAQVIAGEIQAKNTLKEYEDKLKWLMLPKMPTLCAIS